MGNKFSKDSRRKRHANERLKTSFSNSGRIAGAGVLYDDYSEESGIERHSHGHQRFALTRSEEEKEFIINGGPVKCYKLSPEELEKYSKE